MSKLTILAYFNLTRFCFGVPYALSIEIRNNDKKSKKETS